MDREMVIVIDFGGQYNQLVARRVRECNVYCEIYSYKTDIEKIKAMNPKGIILTGGPNSCYEPGAPSCTDELFNLGIPVLGLCYGAQLMMHVLGGKVEKAPVREYGKTEVMVETSSPLFTDVTPNTICWMSHLVLTSAPILRTVLWQQLKTEIRISMPSSSILKFCIHRREQRCFPTSSVVCAVVQAIGKWMPLLKIQLKKSEQK